MILALSAWLACSVAGFLLVDLDAGPTLVSISSDVGLSVVDAVAAVMLLTAWVTPAVRARREGSWPRGRGRGLGPTALIVGLLAASLLAGAVFADFVGRKFAIAAAVLLVQVTAFIVVARRRGRAVPRAQCPHQESNLEPSD